MSDDAVDLISGAIEALVEQFAPLLRATCSRFAFTIDESEELDQDVRIRLWRVIAHGGGKIPSTMYCHRVVLSAAADLLRRRRCGRVVTRYGIDPGALPAEYIVADTGPDLVLERHELEGEIDGSVAMLSAPREMVVRLYLVGFDRLEIARLLGWSEPKVRNLLYRGLSDLRAVLTERGLSPGVLA